MALYGKTIADVIFTKQTDNLNIYITFLMMQDTVAKKCEDNEKDGEDHAFVIYSSLGFNAVVHHHVPVFSCQNLERDTYIYY